MIRPNLFEFEQLAREGRMVPLVMEVPGDLDTPLSALLKIDDGRHSFLLESVQGGERWARYSFLGSSPRMVLRFGKAEAEITHDGHVERIDGYPDPTVVLRGIMKQFQAVSLPGLPQFFGGAVGFMGYDVVRHFERIPDLGRPRPDFDDACFMITRDVVIFDNVSHRVLLTTTVSPGDAHSASAAYAQGVARLERLRAQLNTSMPASAQDRAHTGNGFVSNTSPEEFERMVLMAKQHIKAGDIMQVVLSQRFRSTAATDPLNVYRGLRMINPSPYMFFLRTGDQILAGSSPEVMVRYRGGQAVLRPIAGTRPRGATKTADEQLERELLEDAKEIAEHVMLVDLGRNDLGRIASPGTVSVDEFKTVERYSHVMHIVSNVRAKVADRFDAFDVLKATFPAGTLSGAPKIRAMEIIEDLEHERRGPYGGCVGYFSFTGAMDMGITIRTVTMNGSGTYFQAGAGIVADSDPEREYQETVNKAEAMRRALALAQDFEGRAS